MRQIIPFKKDIILKTRIYEMTSISLEHDLKLVDESISGDFIISGDYKMTEFSVNTESFSYNIPFDIILDTKYEEKTFNIDIHDFYYEIVNSDILRVNIELLIEGTEVKEEVINTNINIFDKDEDNIKIDFSEDINKKDSVSEDSKSSSDVRDNNGVYFENEINILEAKKEDEKNMDKDIQINMDKVVEKNTLYIEETKVKQDNSNIKSIFDSLSDSDDNFVTYYVHILRETENLDEIMQKYSVTKEELSKYNDLSNVSIGNKIVIPYRNAE